MSTYTPGPWVQARVAGSTFIRGEGTPHGPKVATVADTDDVRANARLIAAAPELYEALRALVRVQDAQRIGPLEKGEAWKAARAALAKVEG